MRGSESTPPDSSVQKTLRHAGALSPEPDVSPLYRAQPLRVVYFGTPAFAVPPLHALAQTDGVSVALVVTQPDRPTGRQRLLTPSRVKEAAISLGLPVYQPESLRTLAAREPLHAAEADFFVVAAYGVIFGPLTLSIPRLACVNLHASLLPMYRGASPIPAAIMAGDDYTGVSLMRMERGMDTGPVYAQQRELISERDTTESLTNKLSVIAAELASAWLPRIATDAEATPQDRLQASRVRPLTKADGRLVWTESADLNERRVRAMWPWPRAWTGFETGLLQIHSARLSDHAVLAEPGTIASIAGEVTVACRGGYGLTLLTVQEAGRRPQSATEWFRGRTHVTRLGSDVLWPADPLTVPVVGP